MSTANTSQSPQSKERYNRIVNMCKELDGELRELEKESSELTKEVHVLIDKVKTRQALEQISKIDT